MKWQIIPKDPKKQPNTGTYRDWKPLLAKEGYQRCVYCSIRDQDLGGIRFFHVEHYKPKSKFLAEENNYSNLFYACAVCNVFKGSLWFDHDEADWDCLHFPNPSKHDYKELFELDEATFLRGKNTVAKYLIEILHLNRPHLIRERRREMAFETLGDANTSVGLLQSELERLVEQGDVEAGKLMIELLQAFQRFMSLWVIKDGMPLYYPREMS